MKKLKALKKLRQQLLELQSPPSPETLALVAELDGLIKIGEEMLCS